jgi:dolichol kinase
MIGRRGRFITLGLTGFFLLYARVESERTPAFATIFLQENLFDAVATSWIFLAFYYANGFVAAAFYGPQSRVMDGVLARANCLLITTLWTVFKFVMVPIGAQLALVFAPGEFAVVFALIWGSYMVTDTLAEVGGSLFGKQSIRVWGIGDVNRKSIGGTLSGFVGALIFCLWVVLAHGLTGPWIGLAIVISVSNTLLELFSPRGTDDFTMATANALICWTFGALVL